MKVRERCVSGAMKRSLLLGMILESSVGVGDGGSVEKRRGRWRSTSGCGNASVVVVVVVVRDDAAAIAAGSLSFGGRRTERHYECFNK